MSVHKCQEYLKQEEERAVLENDRGCWPHGYKWNLVQYIS